MIDISQNFQRMKETLIRSPVVAYQYEANNVVEEHPDLVDFMIEQIVLDTLENGYMYNDIDIVWNASCPQWHNGSWLPWLDDASGNDRVVPNCG